MIRGNKILYLCSFMVSVALALTIVAQNEMVSVVGTIYATEGGDPGDTMPIAIVAEADDGFFYYSIVADEQGKLLGRYIGKMIKVTGILQERKDGNVWIIVKKWTIVRTRGTGSDAETGEVTFHGILPSEKDSIGSVDNGQ